MTTRKKKGDKVEKEIEEKKRTLEEWKGDAEAGKLKNYWRNKKIKINLVGRKEDNAERWDDR